MTRAIARFTVRYGAIRVRVRLLPTVPDVDREYRAGRRRKYRNVTPAFFVPASRSDARHVGTIVLPADGRLDELVPHEVAHAVTHVHQTVTAADDEPFATAVGLLCARIHDHLRRLEVRL